MGHTHTHTHTYIHTYTQHTHAHTCTHTYLSPVPDGVLLQTTGCQPGCDSRQRGLAAVIFNLLIDAVLCCLQGEAEYSGSECRLYANDVLHEHADLRKL